MAINLVSTDSAQARETEAGDEKEVFSLEGRIFQLAPAIFAIIGLVAALLIFFKVF